MSQLRYIWTGRHRKVLDNVYPEIIAVGEDIGPAKYHPGILCPPYKQSAIRCEESSGTAIKECTK